MYSYKIMMMEDEDAWWGCIVGMHGGDALRRCTVGMHVGMHCGDAWWGCMVWCMHDGDAWWDTWNQGQLRGWEGIYRVVSLKVGCDNKRLGSLPPVHTIGSDLHDRVRRHCIHIFSRVIFHVLTSPRLRHLNSSSMIQTMWSVTVGIMRSRISASPLLKISQPSFVCCVRISSLFRIAQYRLWTISLENSFSAVSPIIWSSSLSSARVKSAPIHVDMSDSLFRHVVAFLFRLTWLLSVSLDEPSPARMSCLGDVWGPRSSVRSSQWRIQVI